MRIIIELTAYCAIFSSAFHFGTWWGILGAAGIIVLIECATGTDV